MIVLRQHGEAETRQGETILHRLTGEVGTGKIGRCGIELVAAIARDQLRRQGLAIVQHLERMNMAGQHQADRRQIGGIKRRNHGAIAADPEAHARNRAPKRAVRGKPDRRRSQLRNLVEIGPVGGKQIVVDQLIRCAGAIHHHQVHRPQRHGVRGKMAALAGHKRPRPHQPQPAGPGAGTILMIAAHENERRHFQQRSGGGEEIRIPTGPVVA